MTTRFDEYKKTLHATDGLRFPLLRIFRTMDRAQELMEHRGFSVDQTFLLNLARLILEESARMDEEERRNEE